MLPNHLKDYGYDKPLNRVTTTIAWKQSAMSCAEIILGFQISSSIEQNDA